MASLRYLDNVGQLQMRSLDSAQFVVGRAETCQLPIDSDMISREHMRIDVEADGRYRIRDLGSRNKTFVNGEQIRETLLTPGAIIRVGDNVLEFVDDSAGPEKTDLEFVTPDRTDPPDCEWIKIKSALSLTTTQIEQLSQLVGDQPLTARAEDIADAALSQLVLELQAERGLVALRGQGKTDLHPLCHRALKRPQAGSLTPVSQSFLFAPILQRVAGRYPQSAGKMDEKLGYASCAVVAPLTFRGEVVGVLYLDRPAAKRVFTGAALQYCAAAGAQLGALIGESTRKIARLAGREGATWMGTIRRLQSALSQTIPPGDGFAAASRCFAGRLRCGDFASVVPIDEQRCGLIVIDGGGHGITGIAQSSAIRAAIETSLAVSEDALMDPAPMFNAINRMVAGSGARQITPCTFVGIDMSSGKAAYVNAGGMPPLLMVAAGRLVTLDQISLVPGVDKDYAYQTTRVDVPEMFRIVCYTGGLTESTSAAGDPFGDHRLHEALLDREAFAVAPDVLAKIADAWTKHMATAQPADDAMVLVVSRR